MCYPMRRRVAKRMDSTPFHGLEKVNHLPCHNVIFHLCTTRTLPPRIRFFSHLSQFSCLHILGGEKSPSTSISIHGFIISICTQNSKDPRTSVLTNTAQSFFSATKISRASFFERGKNISHSQLGKLSRDSLYLETTFRVNNSITKEKIKKLKNCLDYSR